VIDITAQSRPMGAAAGGQVHASREKFRGTLEKACGGRWLHGLANRLERCAASQAGPARSARSVLPPRASLGFTLDELREARLAPIVSFKGRGGPGATDGAEGDAACKR